MPNIIIITFGIYCWRDLKNLHLFKNNFFFILRKIFFDETWGFCAKQLMIHAPRIKCWVRCEIESSRINLLIDVIKSSINLHSNTTPRGGMFNKGKTIEQIKNTKTEWRNSFANRIISNFGSMVTLCNWNNSLQQKNSFFFASECTQRRNWNGTASVLMKEKYSEYKNQSTSFFIWLKKREKKWTKALTFLYSFSTQKKSCSLTVQCSVANTTAESFILKVK